MKIQLGVLAHPELQRVLGILFSPGKLKVDGLIAWQLFKLQKVLQSEGELLEKARMSLFEQHGDREEDKIQVRPEEIEEFQGKLVELLSSEIEIPEIKLSPDSFKGIEGLEPKDFFVLEALGLAPTC